MNSVGIIGLEFCDINRIFFMKSFTSSLLALLLPFSLTCSIAQAAKLDLEDCDQLLAKPASKELQALLDKNKKAAATGEQNALSLLAGVANNKLVCHEEKITGNSGWGVVMSDDKGNVESQQASGIKEIKKYPEAWASLQDFLNYAYKAGEKDPAYRGMLAQKILSYANDVPDWLERGYVALSGGNQLECVMKKQIGKRDRGFVCQEYRSWLAQYSVKLSQAKRAELDKTALEWAKNYTAK